MSNFGQKTKLAAALATAFAVGSFGAQASVQLATEGLGDAGIIPYYTVKSDPVNGTWRSFIRIFNNSDNAVAVKLRFREAENSREVLNFVVWLSPYDAWTAWTDPDASGTGLGAGIRTFDNSCTTPARQGNNWLSVAGDPEVRFQLFKDSSYSGNYADGGTTGPARAHEGHVEVIGVAEWGPGTQMYQNVKHPPGGSPTCLDVARFGLGGQPSGESLATAMDVGNVLAINSYLIRVESGQSIGVPTTMLANFTQRWSKDGITINPARRLITELTTDDQKPDLDSANPASRVNYLPGISETVPEISDLGTTVGIMPDFWNTWVLKFLDNPTDFSLIREPFGAPIVNGQNGGINPTLTRVQPRRSLAVESETDACLETATPAEWAENCNGVPVPGETGWVYPWVRGGVDAVSAVITRSEVVNEWGYRDDPGALIDQVRTQWVLTFPTKHYYVDIQNDEAIPTYAPFNRDNIYPTLMDFAPVGVNPEPAAYDPFAQRFQATAGKPGGRSCNDVSAWLFDSEENFVSFTSPAPTTIPGLCYETNVINFGDSVVAGGNVGLTSDVDVTIPEDLFPQFIGLNNDQLGWAIMDLRQSPSAGGIPGGNLRGLVGKRYQYLGLPVVGFQITNYQVQSAGNGNYSSSVDHKYTRDITCVGGGCVPTIPNPLP
ncbi:hypothetical protein [Thiocapsa sp.]|nr:hypothetical protein [Thiocapsa sp.]